MTKFYEFDSNWKCPNTVEVREVQTLSRTIIHLLTIPYRVTNQWMKLLRMKLANLVWVPVDLAKQITRNVIGFYLFAANARLTGDPVITQSNLQRVSKLWAILLQNQRLSRPVSSKKHQKTNFGCILQESFNGTFNSQGILHGESVFWSNYRFVR